VIGAALLIAAACGGENPTTPTNTSTGPLVFTAQLSAANVVPPVTNSEANARGLATITLNVPRNSATGAVTGPGTATFVVQLSSFPSGTLLRSARIHAGVAGAVGPVVVDTTLAPATPLSLDASGAGTLNLTGSAVTQADATNIATNPAGFYFTLQTALNGTGAVRGQLARQ
jgi:hypothetical protein